jgi:hypothetical protein
MHNITTSLRKQDFAGASGRVTFSASGDRNRGVANAVNKVNGRVGTATMLAWRRFRGLRVTHIPSSRRIYH